MYHWEVLRFAFIPGQPLHFLALPGSADDVCDIQSLHLEMCMAMLEADAHDIHMFIDESKSQLSPLIMQSNIASIRSDTCALVCSGKAAISGEFEMPLVDGAIHPECLRQKRLRHSKSR